MKKWQTNGIALLILALVTVATFGASWAATAGLYKLVTLCFGWPFSWPVATGIWILWLVALAIFGKKER